MTDTTPPLRWGILGPGNIAHRFATGLQALPDAELVAVGSRTQEKADAFGDQYNVPRRHASYQALVEDPDVDAVYIATPHSGHMEEALRALDAGKPVLVEKPFTINAAQAERVIAKAREKNLFAMEAMWTRFFPLMYRLRELVKGGAIGDVRMVHADFGFRSGVNPEGRLFNPSLGGGGLLDVGVYPISFASMLLGAPEQVTGLAQVGETGVDEQAGMVLRYAEGRLAILSTAIRTNTPQVAFVLGTEGRIQITTPWWKPSAMTVSTGGGSEEISLPFESSGFQFEAQEVARCLREGRTESDVMPLDETLTIMRTMDDLRAQWGVKYPME